MSDLLHNLGERIRTFRKAAGLTREKLAEAAAISTYYVGAIERGEASPSLSVVQDIAQSLQMSVRDLFDFPSEQGTPQEIVGEIVNQLREGEISNVEDLILLRDVVKRIAVGRER